VLNGNLVLTDEGLFTHTFCSISCLWAYIIRLLYAWFIVLCSFTVYYA